MRAMTSWMTLSWGRVKTVGGDLKAVFEEGDAPAYEDDHRQRLFFMDSEVAVPSVGHEEVGKKKERDGAEGLFHGVISTLGTGPLIEKDHFLSK